MAVNVSAHQKYLRTTPRKLRLAATHLRGLKVEAALVKLKYSEKKAARLISKTLLQAQKNAVNNSRLNPATLTLTNIMVDEGPTFKRWQPVSRGRAHPILKRTSHLTITVAGQAQAAKEPHGTKS